MNKNTIIMLAVVVAVILIGLFVWYQYFSLPTSISPSENSNTPTTESPSPNTNENTQSNTPPFSVTAPEIGATGTTGGGTLTVCLDECGNGICQTQSKCENADANCACIETHATCPADCK